jgi:hypothetical protein
LPVSRNDCSASKVFIRNQHYGISRRSIRTPSISPFGAISRRSRPRAANDRSHLEVPGGCRAASTVSSNRTAKAASVRELHLGLAGHFSERTRTG